MSVSGPHQADTIRRGLDAVVDGANPFGAVQATWNVLEVSAGPALAEAHDAGWGVLVKEAMANGRLGPRGEGPHRPILEPIAEAHRVGVDAVAIAVALANPWADVVLSGAVTPEQLRSNVSAVDVRLATDGLEALARLAEPHEDHWRTRSGLAWA